MKQFYLLKYVLLVCIVFSSLSGFTQTGKISGMIRDDTNEPIQGATVKLEGYSKTTTTNNEGYYVLLDIPLGDQTVLISSLGYEDAESNVSVTSDTEVNFQLSTSSTILSQVVVVGYGSQ